MPRCGVLVVSGKWYFLELTHYRLALSSLPPRCGKAGTCEFVNFLEFARHALAFTCCGELTFA